MTAVAEHEHQREPAIDERWLAEWAGFGLAELGTYLDRHARFEAFYQAREARRREREGG